MFLKQTDRPKKIGPVSAQLREDSPRAVFFFPWGKQGAAAATMVVAPSALARAPLRCSWAEL